MADIKIYGKLVANTEDQVVADASSIQDTARNQKLSVTLNELAQGTGLKVLEVNLNNYLSQDGLLALIQGINYATVGDAISYQFTSSIAVDSSYNAVHVTASVSGQGGIDLYLLKSINEKFSCETLVSDGYNSKYKTIQNATLITSSGYIRGIVVTNELVGNLCDLVNGRSELTSTKLSYWFPVGVLPTHIKLANDIIIDLQGNEYCAIGDETVDADISNRIYLNVVQIDINGDFSNVSANDVKVVDFLWQHIENPNNFSFDDLPRFSDSSDVADFPGSSGGEGSGGSGKLYEYSFELKRYDASGNLVGDNAISGFNNRGTLYIKAYIYESNFERLKDLMSSEGFAINTPQDMATFLNTSFDLTTAELYNGNTNGKLINGFILVLNQCDFVYIDSGYKNNTNSFRWNHAQKMISYLGQKFYFTDFPSSADEWDVLYDYDGEGTLYVYGLNVNNSCTLTEYGTSASGGDTPSQSESSYTTISIAWSMYDIRFLLPKFEETQFVTNINQMVAAFNQLMSLSLPTISSYADLETLYNAVSGQVYESVVLGGIIWAINYDSVSVQCCCDGPLCPAFTSATLDISNNSVEWSIDILRLNNGNVSNYNVVSDTNFSSPDLFKVDDLSF